VRAFLINPYDSTVKQLEIEPTEDHMRDIVGGPPALHYLASEVFPDQEGYVNEMGLVHKRKLWFLDEKHVWGPMLILDPEKKLTVSQVRERCILG
jgi:hypothetical protein